MNCATAVSHVTPLASATSSQRITSRHSPSPQMHWHPVMLHVAHRISTLGPQAFAPLTDDPGIDDAVDTPGSLSKQLPVQSRKSRSAEAARVAAVRMDGRGRAITAERRTLLTQLAVVEALSGAAQEALLGDEGVGGEREGEADDESPNVQARRGIRGQLLQQADGCTDFESVRLPSSTHSLTLTLSRLSRCQFRCQSPFTHACLSHSPPAQVKSLQSHLSTHSPPRPSSPGPRLRSAIRRAAPRAPPARSGRPRRCLIEAHCPSHHPRTCAGDGGEGAVRAARSYGVRAAIGMAGVPVPRVLAQERRG